MIREVRNLMFTVLIILSVVLLAACKTEPVDSEDSQPQEEAPAEPAVEPEEEVEEPTEMPPTDVPEPEEPEAIGLQPGTEAGETMENPVDGTTLIFIPEGEFTMGTDSENWSDEKPAHAVYLDWYWIQQTEVTNDMFAAFVEATDHQTQAEQDGGVWIWNPEIRESEFFENDWAHPEGPESDLEGFGEYPVVYVNWTDALAYCEWSGGRLPTEAEWEKAARGTDGLRFPWGDEFDANATTFCETEGLDCFNEPVEVGSYPDGASPYGVHDMFSNVMEWGMDWYSTDYYFYSADENPSGPRFGVARARRGYNSTNDYMPTSVTNRKQTSPAYSFPDTGFRCAYTPTAEADIAAAIAEPQAEAATFEMPTTLSNLPADPQRIEFESNDGTPLVGYYYPSKFENAPLVILGHWNYGPQTDWCRIAPWLQNRYDENPALMTGCEEAPFKSHLEHRAWWDPTWFPGINPENSFAVFTFDLRSFGESDPEYTSNPDWGVDAFAAFQTAANLEGVEESPIFGAGAVYGADATAKACLEYNNLIESRCVGAFSLTPGTSLGSWYSYIVQQLEQQVPPVTTWCVVEEGEADAERYTPYKQCTEEAQGEHYHSNSFPAAVEAYGETGGMLLIDPAYETMDHFMDFLGLFYEELECTENCPVPNVPSYENVIVTDSAAPLTISYDQGYGTTECSLVPGTYVENGRQTSIEVNNLSVGIYTRIISIFEWSGVDVDTRLSDLIPEAMVGGSQGTAICFKDLYTGEVIAEVEMGGVGPTEIILNGPDVPIIEKSEPLEFSIADGPGADQCVARPGAKGTQSMSFDLLLEEDISILAYYRNEDSVEWFTFDEIADAGEGADFTFEAFGGDAWCFVDAETGMVVTEFAITDVVPATVTITP